MDHGGQWGSVVLQGLYSAVSELLQHLKEQFPPHSQNAKVSPVCLRWTAAVPAGGFPLQNQMVFLLSAVDVV